jgi:hypothetical protein
MAALPEAASMTIHSSGSTTGHPVQDGGAREHVHDRVRDGNASPLGDGEEVDHDARGGPRDDNGRASHSAEPRIGHAGG